LAGACGGDDEPAETTAAPTTAATAAPATTAPEPEAPAGFDWRQNEGSEVSILFVSHPFVDSIEPLLPQFEDLTGITVNLESLAEVQANEKLLADLSTGSGVYDVFMSSPLQNWQYATAGWLEPLDSFASDANLTDIEGWAIDDFFPGILGANRWTGVDLEGIGEGDLWGLPINFETYLLAYRPSVFEAKGLEVPETYQDLIAVAEQLNDGSGSQFGIVTRFDKFWDLPYLTFGTMLASYGATLINDDGSLGVCSAESVAATEDFISIISAGSPEGAGAYTWYESLQGFSSGQYALSFNEADLFAPTYQDPEQSEVSDDVGYALTPEGPAGRASGAWIWSVSMSASSQNKTSAWLFLQWLTSPDTMIQTHLGGNMNPVRASAWEDPDVAALVETWGAYPGNYREVVSEMGQVAQILYPPHAELTRALDRWAEAIQQSYFEGGNVEANLCAAQEDIANILGL
jgi:multiple sugar transport system substrate-binding protein